MGAGRVIGNGIASDAGPRALLGNSPTRLRGGLPARGAGLLDCFSAFRLARIIYRRRTAGVFGDLHSRACSGIAGVATRARPAEAATEDVDLLMTAFNYMSHGTQDLYATFLEKQRGFGVSAKSMISIVYATGAICGGAVMGFLSQQWGRRRVIILSAI